MTYESAEGERRPIRLTNLDSFQQAVMWRRYGEVEATRWVVAMVRTALLLSPTVVLDRNQLLDGVVLLALGPDRLRWYLGLEPGAPLPLVVTGAPETDGPWAGEARPGSQLRAVEHPTFESSALAALSPELDDVSPHGWLLGRLGAGPDVEPGATFPRHGESVTRALSCARGAWVDAMAERAVALVPWNDATPVLRERLGERLKALSDTPLLARELTALAADASTLVGVRRSAVLERLSRDRLRPDVGDHEAAAAFSWWNGAYYDAICEANGELRLAFHDVVGRQVIRDDPSTPGHRTTASTSDGSPADTRSTTDQAWGLTLRRRRRWRTWADRLLGSRLDDDGVVRVEGEIVEHMRTISPPRYQQLARSELVATRDLWDDPRNTRMFDLALAVREAVGVTESHSVRLRQRMLRFLGLGSVAVVLALREAELVSPGPRWTLALWVGLAVLAGFPWDDMAEVAEMNPIHMTTTVRISGVER